MATTGSLSDTTTTRKDGVRVDKGIELDENHVRVHYRIVSEREDDAAIRVEESLAAAFPLDALDLDASGGDWLLDGASDRVALLDIIGAGEEVTTGYVVRCDDPNAVASIVDAPEIDMVDPVDGGAATEGAGSAGRDGSREGGGRGDGASTTEASQAAVASAVDANAVAAAIDPGAVADALDADALASALDPEAVVDAMDADAIAAALDAEAVVDALVADVEADALSDAQADALREHLAPAAARSDDLRFAHLRARLEDFAAYADGLEAIIDEHGTATELVDDLRRDVDAAAASAAAVEASLGAASGGHADLAERLDAVDAHLAQSDERRERLDARVATVDDDLASVRASLETLERTCEESLTELAAFASDLEADVVEIDRWREQVGQAFTATETAARAPGSIFRAESDDETTASDAGTDELDAGENAPDAIGDSGDAPAEADDELDYDPTRDEPERDADGN
jgi:hypothetical protein